MQKPNSLYYICHVDNLPSILDKGILSRNQVNELQHQDIHDEGVLHRRSSVPLPNGRPLPDYANLYFHPRNAMLYRLICNDERKKFVILQISPAVLDQPDVFFSDRNAAASTVNFYRDIKYLSKVDDKVFKKDYWTDSDDTKQKMMAEVLVRNKIEANNIIGVYLPQSSSSIRNMAENKSISASVEPYMFFYPTFRKRINNKLSLSKGDMFFSALQTFTISVNLRGVMGKGLASRTKYQFPDAYVRYQDDCKNGRLKVGKPTLFKRGIRIEDELADDASLLNPAKLNGSRWFLFLATKRHWREDSRFEDIEASMQWLLKNYKRQEIESIAMPALGCGLGNLHWRDVGPMMCSYLNKMDITSCIYLPMETELDDNLLSAEYLLHKQIPNPR